LTNSKQLFFQELKDEYRVEFERSDDLEGKSGRLITVCGIFIPLLFGFSSVIIDKGDPTHIMILPLAILLVISLSLAVACIYFCTSALRVRDYTIVFPSDSFLDSHGELNSKEISEFGERNEEGFYDEMIEEYLLTNDQNFKLNNQKAQKLKIAQDLFIGGLAIVPVLVIISLLFFL